MFENFLKEKHGETYTGLDDEMLDAYEAWLEELQTDDFIKYADEAIVKLSAKSLGSRTSKAKAKSSRLNGKKGGRPKSVPWCGV